MPSVTRPPHEARNKTSAEPLWEGPYLMRLQSLNPTPLLKGWQTQGRDKVPPFRPDCIIIRRRTVSKG